jgi:hypothetical protein
LRAQDIVVRVRLSDIESNWGQVRNLLISGHIRMGHPPTEIGEILTALESHCLLKAT